jgi:hypothetical protein
MYARRWAVLLGYGVAQISPNRGILFRNTPAAKLCKTQVPSCTTNMHEAFDEYPVNSGNYMYIYHLQGQDARGFISAVFLSFSVLEHRLALSTAFSTAMGQFAYPSNSKISFTSHSYYWHSARVTRK